jgi:hypothetical protein
VRDDFGDGGMIFRKVNPFVFLMLIPSFIRSIFLPLIYA